MSWDKADDATVLNRALRDKEAFGVFYEQHALAVYRSFVYHVQRDESLAAELTAETFAGALRSLRGFAGSSPGSGTAWLFGIARNLGREHHRSRRVREDARRELGMPRGGVIDSGFQDADDRIDSERLRQALDAAIAELPAAQRQAVTLRVLDDLDYAALARATSATEQTARLRVTRGLRALRAQLAPAMTEEEQ